MTEQEPEFNKLRETADDRTIDLSEQKSITGSAQTVAFEPTSEFVAPSMALDSFEPESDS